jgi:hypothetical protein
VALTATSNSKRATSVPSWPGASYMGQMHLLGAIIDAKDCVKLIILVPVMGSVQSGPVSLVA